MENEPFLDEQKPIPPVRHELPEKCAHRTHPYKEPNLVGPPRVLNFLDRIPVVQYRV